MTKLKFLLDVAAVSGLETSVTYHQDEKGLLAYKVVQIFNDKVTSYHIFDREENFIKSSTDRKKTANFITAD